MSCHYQSRVTAENIMHDSPLQLDKWLIATYLKLELRKEDSANQMMPTVGIGSYRTASHLCHPIREAPGTDQFDGPRLCGAVQVDETLIDS